MGTRFRYDKPQSNVLQIQRIQPADGLNRLGNVADGIDVVATKSKYEATEHGKVFLLKEGHVLAGVVHEDVNDTTRRYADSGRLLSRQE
jgi:hypothetical protein